MDVSEFPSSEAEFRGRFADEDHCREYLARLKWPEGFRCAHCAGDRAYFLPSKRVVYECAGCGRQVSQGSAQNLSLLATGPDSRTLPTPRPFVAAAFDATGGLAAWQQCRKVEFHAAVTACERSGGFYLTEHDFVLCPWSNAIQVTADEPRAHFTWQMISGRYHPPADPNLRRPCTPPPGPGCIWRLPGFPPELASCPDDRKCWPCGIEHWRDGLPGCRH